MAIDPSHFIDRAIYFRQQSQLNSDPIESIEYPRNRCVSTCLQRYYDKESGHWYSIESATDKFCQDCCYLKSYPFNPYKFDQCRQQYYQLVKTYDSCCNPITTYQYLKPVVTKKPWQSSFTVEYVVACPNPTL